MSTVEELRGLLCAAAGIIRQQAALLEMHGIKTADGGLEAERRETMENIRALAGEDEERDVYGVIRERADGQDEGRTAVPQG